MSELVSYFNCVLRTRNMKHLETVQHDDDGHDSALALRVV